MSKQRENKTKKQKQKSKTNQYKDEHWTGELVQW
jgi:hypothetical protein